jgi:hypothetical protein
MPGDPKILATVHSVQKEITFTNQINSTMQKDFEVTGKIVIHVSLDVKGQTEEEALKAAIEDLKAAYNLDVHGYHHEPSKVDYDNLISSEIEWEEEQ